MPETILNNNAFEEDKQNAFDSGMNGHVAKPVDIQKLKETIAKFV